MESVTRIGVSLEPELLKAFDESISKKGYVSRSEALRDLVRDSLAENSWKNDDTEMIGVIITVIDLRATQQMAQSEIELWQWNFWLQVFEDPIIS